MSRPRRSLLFMPGDSERKIRKAAELTVDSIVLDLEDGVASDRKAEGRAVIAQMLAGLGAGASERLVRVNPIGSGLEEDDFAATVSARPDGYVLPKVESAQAVKRADEILGQAEQARGWPAGSLGLVALIETARGVVEAAEIARASARLRALCFGAEDFAASVGATRSPEGTEVLYARSAVLVAAAAAEVQAIDALFLAYQDDEGLGRAAAASRAMGFDGMMAIHPRQVPIIQEAFTPADEEIAQARRLLDAYEAHRRKGLGAFSLDGKMVDMPMVRAARRVLARAGFVVEETNR